MDTGFWWENLEKGEHLEVSVIDGKIILKWNLKEQGGKAWIGFTWLKTGSSGELL